MSKYIIKVPASVDVEGLLGNHQLSKTVKKNRIERIQYVLSRIMVHNDNFKKYENVVGYRKVCCKVMHQIVGKKDYQFIQRLLTESVNPIIETPGSYLSRSTSATDAFCKSYRLTKKYATGEFYEVELSQKFAEKIRSKSKNAEKFKINERYQFLHDQFNIHSIKLDPTVYQYVFSFGQHLLLLEEHKFQREIVYNLIGRWLYNIEKIVNGILWHTGSEKNHRFSSTITNLPKQLRNFLLIENEPVVIVDISSSQPYLLSSLLNSNFFTNTNIGYNVKTTFPIVYNKLINELKIHNNISNGIKTSITMWGKKYTPEQIESIIKYQQAPFTKDFYTSIIEEIYNDTNNDLPPNMIKIREDFKGFMMYILFSDNNHFRHFATFIRMFRAVYPGVCRWIEDIHKIIGKVQFSYLLQRAESHIVLDVIAREFHSLHPTAPIFTIHDGIYTHDQFIPDLIRIVKSRCKEITGVNVGLKTKTHLIDPNPSKKDIDLVWEEIQKVNTKRKFDKKKGLSVLECNIQKGQDFLKNYQKF